jgi:thiosulfate reductase cytochrome b subunit
MGRVWHFAAAWVFSPSLFLYLIYSLLSRRRRRRIGPSRAQWRGLPRTIVDHVRLRFRPHADYNGLQKLAYLIVLFGLLPLMVGTGLTMSPTIDANWPWLLTLFDGRQSARTIHFFCAFTLLAFFVIHVVLVLISGVFNNMRSMITGGYKVRAPAPRESEHGNGQA